MITTCPTCGATWDSLPGEPDLGCPACPGAGPPPEPSREAWHERRRQHITATDWAGILGAEVEGLRDYASPLEVWARKQGVGRDADGDAASFGRFVETQLLLWAAPRLPYEVELWDQARVEVCPSNPLFSATPDARLLDEEGRDAGRNDAKTTGRAIQWRDGPPIAVQAQMQAQMLCSETDLAIVDAAIHQGGDRGWELEIFELRRNEEFLRAAIPRLEDWWSTHVIGGRPPAPDGSERDAELLKLLYREVSGPTAIALEPEWSASIARFAAVRSVRAKLEKEETAIKSRLHARLGHAEVGATPDGRLISWRKASDGSRRTAALKHPPRGVPGPYDGAWRAPQED